MLLNEQELNRLKDLLRDIGRFKDLSVIKSWVAWGHCQRRIYIHRGPLLIEGHPSGCSMLIRIFILLPGSTVTPILGDPRYGIAPFPQVTGDIVMVGLSEDGPWTKYLRKELKKMEAELAANKEKLPERSQILKEQKLSQRAKLMEKAKLMFKELPQ